MSSGTLVKVERYYNRFHFQSKEEIKGREKQLIKEREDYWGQIRSLMMATPIDITPKDETPEQYISERLDTIRELLDECDYQLMACSDIDEGWETREED